MRLTDQRVQSLAAPEKGQRDYRCDSISGFVCRVSQGGTKTFILIHGKDRRRTTIGRYPSISLKMAREAALRLIAERTLGRHQNPRQSVREALDAFLAFHQVNNRPGTHAEVRRILTKQFASLHRHQLGDLTTHDITRITDRMVADGRPSAATHAHMAIRNFLGWCVRRRLLDHSPIEGLERPAPLGVRDRVLSDEELRAVWQAAEQTPSAYGRIVQLAILTGARRGEIQHVRLEGDTAVIDAAFVKNGRAHRFPISKLARPIIEANSDLSWGGWSKAKSQLDRKVADQFAGVGKLAPWTLHDIRRTYATNLQRLSIRLEVIESLLNHVSGTRAGIVGVYQRHAWEAEMREAVQKHDQWIRGIIRT